MSVQEVVSDLINDVLSYYREVIHDREGRPYPSRELFDEVVNLIEERRPLIMIQGLRGTGKTFLLYQLLDYYTRRGIRIYYLQLSDLYRRLQDPEETFYGIFRFMGERPRNISERTILLLDEVQQVPGWDGWLKEIYDKSYFHRRLTVVATGSSSLALTIGSDVMRRATIRVLHPLSFREYLLLRSGRSGLGWKPAEGILRQMEGWLEGKRLDLRRVFRTLDTDVRNHFGEGLEDLFLDYITQGGFPIFLRSSTTSEYFEYLRGMVDKVIKDDLTLRKDLESSTLSLADDVLTFLADVVGSPVSLDKIASRIGVAKGSVRKLLEGLSDTGLISPLKSCGTSARIREPRKYYFAHPDLIPAVLGLRSRRSLMELVPSLLENSAYSLFLGKGKVEDMCYVGAGADFLINYSGRKILLEVARGKEKTSQFRRSGRRYDMSILATLSAVIEEDEHIRVPLYLLAFI